MGSRLLMTEGFLKEKSYLHDKMYGAKTELNKEKNRTIKLVSHILHNKNKYYDKARVKNIQ